MPEPRTSTGSPSRTGRARAVRPRPALSRAAIVTAAMDLADADGLDAVTMRALADRFSVTPMSLYHHLPTKDAILDAMTDALFAEVVLPQADPDWRACVGGAALAMRETLLRHPWGIRLVESRTAPGPGTLRHHDTVLGFFRTGGFSLVDTGIAIAVLDSYIYGFVVQEMNLPFGDDQSVQELADDIMASFGTEDYPNLTELAMSVVAEPGYAFGNQFERGLDLVLDSLATLARR